MRMNTPNKQEGAIFSSIMTIYHLLYKIESFS